jgi:hypothetical protein
MIDALQAALQAAHGSAGVQRIETHISYVLVAGTEAWKFKKVLRTGFLDFGTLARRWHCCHEELRLNRRLAPDLYLDVLAVAGPAEAPRLGGDGPVIDCAVRMRAFDPDGLWDRIAARAGLQPAQVDALAAAISEFHRHAAVAAADGTLGSPRQVRAPMRDNLDELQRLLTDAQAQARLRGLRRWEAAAWAVLQPVFAERLRAGRVRECHGDLHLGNVAEIEGRTTVFDCIEFNDEFRWIDVMSEIAFMAMDLQDHGRADLAARFVDACLERSGDYEGVRVLRYYLVHRALVRAKVAALRAGQAATPQGWARARHYLGLAARDSQPASPLLMIAHGPSGSGKTTLSEGLLEATGAIRVRADVERKRAHGLDARAHAGAALNTGLYSAQATADTYRRLNEAAAAVLDGGFSVLLDATFLQRRWRDAARELAAARRVRFVILDFDADSAVLRQRVARRAARGDDASDADLAVLEAQLRTAEPLGADERAAAFRCRAAAAAAPNAEDAPELLRWLALPPADVLNPARRG